MIVAACVLAAGASSRMGADKALVVIEGQPFLARLLGSLDAAGAAPLFVVTRAGAARTHAIAREHAARVLVNPDPERGMLSSIQTCVRFLGESRECGVSTADALLVAPVDCPRVRPETMTSLIAAAACTGAPIVVPRHARRRGHPVLFGRAVFRELLDAPAQIGARAVVRAHAHDRIELDVDDPFILDDFDSPSTIPPTEREETEMVR